MILAVFIFSSVALGAYTINAALGTPQWDPKLLASQKESSIVYDKDGKQIAQLHASENRLLVDYEDIPELVEILLLPSKTKDLMTTSEQIPSGSPRLLSITLKPVNQ